MCMKSPMNILTTTEKNCSDHLVYNHYLFDIKMGFWNSVRVGARSASSPWMNHLIHSNCLVFPSYQAPSICLNNLEAHEKEFLSFHLVFHPTPMPGMIALIFLTNRGNKHTGKYQSQRSRNIGLEHRLHESDSVQIHIWKNIAHNFIFFQLYNFR